MITFLKISFNKAFNPNGIVEVTSWALENPDLDSGRWVMIGQRTWWNYLKSGVYLVYYKGSFYKYPYKKSLTKNIQYKDIEIPWKEEFFLGIIKTILLGQFKLY